MRLSIWWSAYRAAHPCGQAGPQPRISYGTCAPVNPLRPSRTTRGVPLCAGFHPRIAAGHVNTHEWFVAETYFPEVFGHGSGGYFTVQ